MPAPISELEFDLLGAGYADGYGRALTALAGQPVKALVRREHGHLYTALAVPAGQAPVAPPSPPATPDWAGDVQPRITEHLKILRDLAGQPTGRALTEARRLFAEVIMLHHAMLLPARAATAQLVGLTAGLADEPPAERVRQAALAAVIVMAAPLHLAAERLADAGPPDALTDAAAVELVGEGAADGDGYGLALPGWLDDASYARRAHRLLQRFGVTSASLRRGREAAAARRDEAVAFLRGNCPPSHRGEFEAQLARAQDGAALAEAHGPILHVRYLSELRRLVLAHGQKLVFRGLLYQASDIMHARLGELARTLDTDVVRSRALIYQARMGAAVPPAELRARAPAGYQPVPPELTARLGMPTAARGRRSRPGAWLGTAASPGCGRGQLRIVRSQADIDKVMPGEVALVPDAGPAWGWLAVAGVPLIIEHGAVLGHAPALARGCAAACVIAGPGFASVVRDGESVTVSGDTGLVTW